MAKYMIVAYAIAVIGYFPNKFALVTCTVKRYFIQKQPDKV